MIQPFTPTIHAREKHMPQKTFYSSITDNNVYSSSIHDSYKTEITQTFINSSVQSLSSVRLFVTPWTTAHQASLSITNSEFTQTHVHWVGDAIQPSPPLLAPSPPTFNLSQYQGLFKCQLFEPGGQSIGVSASASVLPMNTQDWLPLGWTGWISL